MRRVVALLSLMAVCAFGDPLTLTILGGTEQASAGGYDFGNQQSCSTSGSTQAFCAVFGNDYYNPHEQVASGQAATSWTTVSAGGGGIIGYIPGYGFGSGQFVTSGWGASSVHENLLITGGTGAGYLIMTFSVENVGGPEPIAYVLVNGQCLAPNPTVSYTCQMRNEVANESGLFSFTFGQPFSLDMSVSAGSDGTWNYGYASAYIGLTSAVAYDAYPYPTGVFEGGNPAPDIPGSDVTGVLVSGIPEPNTALLAAGVLGLVGIGLVRRVKRMAE